MVAGRARLWLLSLIGLIIVLTAIVVVLTYSGYYNVSATYRDPAPIAWVFRTTMASSVRHHAAGIKIPALDNPSMVEDGADEYAEHCTVCHGAPGVRVNDLGRGLNPHPPELTDAAKDWKPRELFWITKHGIRMSGMPAWGVTHSDSEMLKIVAFLKKMPKMSPEQYKSLTSSKKRATNED